MTIPMLWNKKEIAKPPELDRGKMLHISSNRLAGEEGKFRKGEPLVSSCDAARDPHSGIPLRWVCGNERLAPR
jgi:hypothetical protein